MDALYMNDPLFVQQLHTQFCLHPHHTPSTHQEVMTGQKHNLTGLKKNPVNFDGEFLEGTT